jgi:hypothetical protein
MSAFWGSESSPHCWVESDCITGAETTSGSEVVVEVAAGLAGGSGLAGKVGV